MTRSASRRDGGVDLLRAICILYIVGYWHLFGYTDALPHHANWFTEGLKYWALATFVFCSGRLLARRPAAPGIAGLWSFYRRRLWRIYPLYALSLASFGAAGIASQQQVVEGSLLISMFVPPAMPTLWFVTMIMLFYLIAPPLIRIADRPVLTAAALGTIVLALLAYHTQVRPLDLRLLIYLPAFALGILYQRQPRLPVLAERFRWPALVLAALLLPLSHVGDEQTSVGALILIPLTLTAPIALTVFAKRAAPRFHGPTVTFLAYAGFGLYLCHRLVFKGAIALYFPTDEPGQAAYLFLVALPCSLLLGAGMQWGYDRLTARLSPADGRG